MVDLPHISNFTDFDALRVEEDVSLRIVRAGDELGEPDAVILPGSKNVLHDLDYLRRSGLADRLLALARGGRTEIVGICGGLQLLGREIRDPDRIESAGGGDLGLGLLNAVTTMASEKTLARAEGTHVPSGCRVVGYEIHHGRPRPKGNEVILRRSDGRGDRLCRGRSADLGHVPARHLRRRRLPAVVRRPPPRAARMGPEGRRERAVRHRAGPRPPGAGGPREPRHGAHLSADAIAMRLEYQILLAVLLDLLIGDPRWRLHPVRLIGWLAAQLETVTRAVLPARAAGALTALAVIAAAGGAAWGLVRLAGAIHPYAADAVRIALIYTTIAARDLAQHSMSVYRALVQGDLPEARKRVGLIVGRDTADLDERGVTRAAVESVAESIVDGVTAPLFFAAIAGPVGAVVYRAVNTLDSMFGYRNERYLRFGWASARLDDAANFIPARLTAPLICLAALLLRGPCRAVVEGPPARRAQPHQPELRLRRGRRGRRAGRAARRA